VGEWWERWRSDRRVIGAVLACLAIVALVAWVRTGASATPALPAPAPPTSRAPARDPTTSIAAGEVVADVVGAVRRPGIVRMAAGARVVDAIAAAGGAAAGADLTRLNLAAPVADGSRIAVPRLGEPALPVDPGAVSGAGPPGTDPSGPVDLNTATADQLDALPGIGPATAAAIVRDRDAHGPFASVDDLARVRGIGPAKLDQLRGLVTV
jgi:competence protein ComEA